MLGTFLFCSWWEICQPNYTLLTNSASWLSLLVTGCYNLFMLDDWNLETMCIGVAGNGRLAIDFSNWYSPLWCFEGNATWHGFPFDNFQLISVLTHSQPSASAIRFSAVLADKFQKWFLSFPSKLFPFNFVYLSIGLSLWD